MNLTARQTKFVEEYVVSGNAAEAARAAGYSANGAKVTACRMLTKANLKAAIAVPESRRAGAETAPKPPIFHHRPPARTVGKKWTMPIREWKAAMIRFTIQCEDRMTQH